MSDGDFIARLATRRPELDALEPGWKLVDDTLSGKLKRRGGDGWYSPYLPKGRLEPAGEYSLRMELTPFFPQAPQLLASRLGALFKTRPQIDCPALQNVAEGDEAAAARRASFERFLKCAGRRHTPFEDLAVQAAFLAQTHGFCAVLLDRDPLPHGVEAGAVSHAQAVAENLGRPYLALYSAPEVLDWDFGSDGRLAWVKFGEEELWRPTWDAPAERVRVYRVVDRSHIHVYRVKRAPGAGDWTVAAATPVAHGFGGVPVVFLHPFPGADEIGRSILLRTAEADIAAARVLSDLVWDLFLLGNPILTLKTARNDQELAQLGLGATRYIPLRNGRPGVENPEELSFVQLDPTGMELLFRAHGLFASQARQAGGGAEDAAAIPQQQTGIAQAWRFKTGEERVLFVLARALEPFLARCLELAIEALNLAPAPSGDAGCGEHLSVAVRLPESFDVTSPAETLDSAGRLLDLAEKYKQTELARAALQRIEAALGMLPAQTRNALQRERDELRLEA